MHFASLHGQDRTLEAQQISLLIYVDSYTSADMPAHTHPHIGLRIRIRMNEPNESASEPNERVNRAN